MPRRLASLGLFVWLACAGCGDPCEDLQLICDRCQDPNHKAACEKSVDEDPDDVCEQNIDSYDAICD
jgi:hypothetical protein